MLPFQGTGTENHMEVRESASEKNTTSAALGDSSPVIAVKGLRFGFNTQPVLEDLAFTVGREEFVSFIGPSGCGKTTLLYLLLGLRTGYTGHIEVRATKTSFVFQHDSLLEWRDALSNVLLPLEVAGFAVDDRVREEAQQMLELVGLNGFGHLYPAELSGGMKKRVELARALITQPELLVLDEPFSSLDILSRERLNLLLKRIHVERRSTVVMVTHSVEEACFLSDRVYVLSGAPAKLLEVETIPREAESAREQFSLSGAEIAANNAIRVAAKTLWNNTQEIAEQEGALKRSAAGLKITRAARSVRPPEPEQSEMIRRSLLARVGGQLQRRYNLFLIPVELVALFYIVTFIKVHLQVPDFVFPLPGAVLHRFIATLANGSILPDLEATLYESAFGFLIAFAITIVLGYAIAKSRVVFNLVMPYLIALNTIPSVALAPFLVLWFGFGMTPKIITCVIVMFFPMLINNVSAIALASERTRVLVTFYRPSRFRAFTKFEFPAALPVIASGIKVSITLSVIGAVVGEFVSGHSGLGSLVNEAKANFDMALMFVGLLWLSLLGLFYFGVATAVFALVNRRRRFPSTGR